MDHYIARLHQAYQVVAGRGHASACCRRSLEVSADVIAAGYLHPYVLADFTLPPVTRPLLGAMDYGRREGPLQTGCAVQLVARNINAEPDAFGGITTLGRIGCLRDLGLGCTKAASQGIGVWFRGEPDRRLDEPAVFLGHAQVLCVPRVHQGFGENCVDPAQPGQQDSKRPVVVRVPWRPSARRAAAAINNEG
jgi:hypothetical protein